MTLDEFISDENWPKGSTGFRLPRGRVVWTMARYTEGNSTGLAEVSRIVHVDGRPVNRFRSVDPSTPIEFVFPSVD